MKLTIKPYVFNVKDEKISYFTLTKLFLICSANNGVLYRIYLKNYKLTNETKHTNNNKNGIQSI